MRLCKICNIEKDESKFDKHRYTCRQCRWKRHKERLTEKGILPKKRKKRKDAKSVEEKKETRRQYYLKNKEKIIKQTSEYRNENKEKIKIAAQKYYKENIDKITSYHKEYREQNKDKIRVSKRESEKRRMVKDPSFRIRKYLRNGIYCALIRNKSSKSGLSILKYLPYSMEELKNHLENQFESWMTWDGWGIYSPDRWDDNDSSTWTWQLDHIVPQSCFEYTAMTDDSFKECWALDNLRPLSAKVNVLEGTRGY